jgi:hypothetical protein
MGLFCMGNTFNVFPSVLSAFLGILVKHSGGSNHKSTLDAKKGSQLNLTASFGGNKKGKETPYISRGLLP